VRYGILPNAPKGAEDEHAFRLGFGFADLSLAVENLYLVRLALRKREVPLTIMSTLEPSGWDCVDRNFSRRRTWRCQCRQKSHGPWFVFRVVFN